MSANRFIFTGNLTRDPEFTPGVAGKPAIVTLQLANDQFWYDGEGVKQERTNFFRLKAFGKAAQNHHTYLIKGSKLYAEGRIEATEYMQDDVKRYGIDFIAESIEYLDPKSH